MCFWFLAKTQHDLLLTTYRNTLDEQTELPGYCTRIDTNPDLTGKHPPATPL